MAPVPNQWPTAPQSGWSDQAPALDGSGYPIDVRFTREAPIGRFWGIPVIGFIIRAIALIPHIFLLYFVGLLAMLLSLITWIPLLVTGRYPGWGYTFVGGYLRWALRVASWLYLMSGTYPPFTGGPADGQHVRVLIDEDRPVGRFWGIPVLGFLVRYIILIPHYFVLALLGFVAFFLIVFSWLPVLLYGRQADLVYTVVGGYLRWLTRVSAYLFLMSGPYPPFRLD